MNNNVKAFYLLFIGISSFVSCKSQDVTINITPELVLSEHDRFVAFHGNIVITKYDYYLIKVDANDINDLKKAIDSFAIKTIEKHSDSIDDHLMYFYKESSSLNKKVLEADDEKLRYKNFLENKEECFIASYDFRYRNKILEKPLIEYGSKYK